MAVFTSITKETLLSFLKNYKIGELINFEGILAGVENTTYKIITSKNVYILTIFEKRIDENDLPYIFELQNFLSSKKIRCPKPVLNQSGQYTGLIDKKTCVIMSFLDGEKLENVTPKNCVEVSSKLAAIHLFTKDFKLIRKNSLNYDELKKIFNKCLDGENNNFNELISSIKDELNYLEKHWPTNLPKGIIHGDVFPDNVFINDKGEYGFIDFYFACNDYFAYELAIFINAWCFDKNNNFLETNYKAIIEGYEGNRKLNKEEVYGLPVLLRGAAIRIIITRLYDILNHPEDAKVKPKDPFDYFEILKFHQKNNII